MNKIILDEIGNISGVDGEELAKVNRSVNYSLLTGQTVGDMYDNHDAVKEATEEGKRFYSELQKARQKDEYNPLNTFNADAPDGVCPVTGTTAKDHAGLWYQFVKPWVDTGMSFSEGFNNSAYILFKSLDMVGDFIGRKVGGDPNYGKGGLFREAAGYFQNKHNIVKSGEKMLPEPIGPVARFAGETAGSFIPGVAKFLLDITGVGPIAIAGPSAAQGEIDRRNAIIAQNKKDFGDNVETFFSDSPGSAEFKAFCKGAIESKLMGSILHAMSGLYRPYRAAGTAALFGEQYRNEAGDDFDAVEFLKAITTGGLFGTMGGKGKFGINDITGEMVKLNSELGERGSVKIGNRPDNVDQVEIVEPSPQEFIASREKSTSPQFLTPYTAEELSGMKLFKAKDSDAGYALKEGGDLVNVFNDSNIPGLGKKLINDAISKGATKLDCFDIFLPEYYAKFGFKEVRRDIWNDKYKPEGWLDKDGKPDIIYMELGKGAQNDNSRKSTETSSRGQSAGDSGSGSGTFGLDGRNNPEEGREIHNRQPEPSPEQLGVRSDEFLTDLPTPKPEELSARIRTLKTELAQMQVGSVLSDQRIKNIKNLVRIETGQVKAGELLVPEYKALTASMKKAEQASTVAFREGKKEGIAVQKAHELELAERLKARMEARQEVRDIIGNLKDVQKNVQYMTPYNADNITSLLDTIDLVKLSTRKQLELSRTREFLQSNPDTELPDYVFDDLARLDKTPAKDLTFAELQSLHKAVMQYAHQSEMVQKLWDGRELKDKKEVLENVVSEMAEPGEKMGKLISLKPTVMDQFRSWGDWIRQTLGIRQDSYHLIVESLSGINSTVHRVLSRDINAGTDNQKRYYQQASDQFRADLKAQGFDGNKSDKWKIKSIHDWLNDFVKIKIGGHDVEIRRGQVMSIYRHSLNEDNRAAMIDGGIGFKQTPKGSNINPNTVLRPTEGDIQRIIDNMTPAEKAFAGAAVDNLFNNQWSALNDVFVRVNRYRLDRQDNYFPKDVMPLSRGGLSFESEEGLEAFRQFSARVGIEKGMLKARQGSQAPIYINDMMHDITVSLEKSAGYIGLEEPMRRASALLYNADFQREIIDRYGRETWVEIEKGLKDISGTARQFNETEKGLMKLKTNAVSSILNLNPWIWANQPFGLLMFQPYVEMKYLMKGIIDAATKPTETLNSLKAHSPMLIDRIASGYDRDVAARFQQSKDVQLYGGGTGIIDKGLVPTKAFDIGAIVPGMQAATYKVMAEFEAGKLSKTVSRALDMTDADIAKLSPEQKIIKAHEFADWVVENTQAMGGKEHHAPIQRGGVAEQMMTAFGSQTNAMLNLTRRTYRQWQRTKDPEDKKTFVKAACQVFLVNAAAMTLLDRARAALYNRDPKSFIEGMIDNAAGTMFVIRDVEKTLVSHLQKGKQGYDAKWPVTRAIELVSNMGADINTMVTSENQKKIEEAWLSFIDNNISLAAISTGMPYDAPKQVIKATFGEEPPKKKHRPGVIDEIENDVSDELGIDE